MHTCAIVTHHTSASAVGRTARARRGHRGPKSNPSPGGPRIITLTLVISCFRIIFLSLSLFMCIYIYIYIPIHIMLCSPEGPPGAGSSPHDQPSVRELSPVCFTSTSAQPAKRRTTTTTTNTNDNSNNDNNSNNNSTMTIE